MCSTRSPRWRGPLVRTDPLTLYFQNEILSGEQAFRALSVFDVGARTSLESILEALCRVVEQTAGGCCCSVILIDPGGSRIQQVVAPSLPASYNDRFPGTPVDRDGGPCTEAARRKTLAIYWREPRIPTAQDQKLIEQITHLAAVAIERKRNEAALQQSEERFRLIVDSIPGMVCTLSAAGEVELLSRQVLEYFGKTTAELKNWAISDAVPGWNMLLTDIDDRRRAEEALRSNEQSLRLVVDSIPGFVATMSATGETELVNRQSLEYFGKTAEELKNWATSDILHSDDLPRMMDAWSRGVETGQPIEVEHRSRGADGMYRWFLLRAQPQRDADGRIVRWYSLVTDIDDRKKAEEGVRRSEAYLTDAQHLSRTGSFGCKVSSGEMFWSEETFRIFGYDRATKPAVEAILERTHPEDRSRVQEQIHRATREGKDCDLEYRLLLPDDSVTRPDSPCGPE